jgi:hypothetical protein
VNVPLPKGDIYSLFLLGTRIALGDCNAFDKEEGKQHELNIIYAM